jgi:hypothetical protein
MIIINMIIMRDVVTIRFVFLIDALFPCILLGVESHSVGVTVFVQIAAVLCNLLALVSAPASSFT